MKGAPYQARVGPGPLVDVEGLVHIYRTDELEVVALQGLDLQVAEREMTAIVGRSGSGKTTLMNVLAGVETPSAGHAHVAGHDLARMSGADREAYRRDVVGYVWQRSQVNPVARARSPRERAGADAGRPAGRR